MLNLPPMRSILNAGKYLPLAYAPMPLEVTFADSAAFLMPGTTGSYTVENMSLRASLVRLDSAVQASFAAVPLVALAANRAWRRGGPAPTQVPGQLLCETTLQLHYGLEEPRYQ